MQRTRPRVLVIEDDGDILDVVTLFLEGEGYDVVRARHGLEALERLRSRPPPPDVILLDLMMPVMDGWQFCHERRRDGRLASIPVVLLTANGEAEKMARKLGAEGALRKPLDLDALLGAVARFAPPAPGNG